MNKGELNMNIKQILMAAAIVAISATAAMAEDATAPSSPAAAGDHHKGRHEMKFEDRKAHALERLQKASARVQEKQACVQAATDKNSLQSCFPKRGQVKGDGKGGWHKHDV